MKKIIKEPCSSPYLPIPVIVLDSVAWRTASSRAAKMLIDIARSHNPVKGNNGHLSGGRAYLRTRGWKSAKQIQKALIELQGLGLLELTKRGGLNMGSNLFAVTWLDITNYTGLDITFFRRGAWSRLQPLPPLKPSQAVPGGGNDCPSAGQP